MKNSFASLVRALRERLRLQHERRRRVREVRRARARAEGAPLRVEGRGRALEGDLPVAEGLRSGNRLLGQKFRTRGKSYASRRDPGHISIAIFWRYNLSTTFGG